MRQKRSFQQLRKAILITLLTLPATLAFAQHKRITRLGIVNPTPTNMHNAMNLISKHYITADSLVIVGIYHQSQRSSLAATNKFLEENGYNDISIEIIEGELLIKNLFKKNICTTQFEELFANTDGLIFFGGYDIPPHAYNEETFLTTEHFNAGKNWELSFMHHLIGGSQSNIEPLLLNKPNYTILGICLGMQEMNVASGGTLYQDIPYQVYGQTTYEGVLQIDAANIHKNYNSNIGNQNSYTTIHFHPIATTPGNFLDLEGVSKNPVVPSVHHQAAKNVAQNLEVVATSMDRKVVEALQHIRFKNVYGIQFHSDFSSLYDDEHEFVISPQETLVLSDDTRSFLQQFWCNFSKRLNQAH